MVTTLNMRPRGFLLHWLKSLTNSKKFSSRKRLTAPQFSVSAHPAAFLPTSWDWMSAFLQPWDSVIFFTDYMTDNYFTDWLECLICEFVHQFNKRLITSLVTGGLYFDASVRCHFDCCCSISEMEMSPLDPGFFNTSTMPAAHHLYTQQTFEVT